LLLAATMQSFAHMPLGISDRNSFKSPARNGDLKSMSFIHIVTSMLVDDSYFLLKLFLFQ